MLAGAYTFLMVELGAVESPEGEVLLFDGIALITRGDLMMILYQADAGIRPTSGCRAKARSSSSSRASTTAFVCCSKPRVI